MSFPYIPASPAEEREMLAAIGVGRFEDLLAPIPDNLRRGGRLNLPGPLSELEALRDLTALAGSNGDASKLVPFAGGGSYDHFIPSVIDAVTMRSEFYTAYTPYQSEVSQGTLTAIFEFQTMIAALTGLPVANASLYDGGSACGEAGHLALAATGRKKIVVAGRLHPAYLQVLKTYLEPSGGEVVVDAAPKHTASLEWLESAVDEKTAAVLVQHPNFFGQLEPVAEIRRISAAKGALLVAVVDPLTLGILAPPGEYGADIAVGDAQPLGIPMSFGGPVAGFFAASDKYLRLTPGRLVGETVDRDGKRAFTLTLQTREQHIRREKATSNICTNQTLLAHRATVYLSLLGPAGIREVGEQCAKRARHAAKLIGALPGYAVDPAGPFVKEFVVRCPVPAAKVVEAGIGRGLLAGVDLGRFDHAWSDRLLVAVTEKRSAAEIERLAAALKEVPRG